MIGEITFEDSFQFVNKKTNRKKIPMGKTKNKQHLGAAIIKNKEKLDYKKWSERHLIDETDESTDQIRSIIEQNDLNEFVNYATISSRDFTAEKEHVTFVVDDVAKHFT